MTSTTSRHEQAGALLGRSHVTGAPSPARAPNDGHRAVADLQRRGHSPAFITQTWTAHQAGGARDVIELHGSLDRVISSAAAAHRPPRLDRRLHGAIPIWRRRHQDQSDGDVRLDDNGPAAPSWPVWYCDGGVSSGRRFFGENCLGPRVEQCYQLVDDSDALLVLALRSRSCPPALRSAATPPGRQAVLISTGSDQGRKRRPCE